MASYTLSCIKDVDGNSYNIKAKGLENQVTLALTGDVTGTQTTTFDTGTTTSIAATIGSEAVTASKIAASAVTTAKIADLNVTLDKLASSVMSGSVADNDGKLSTHAAVKTYVEGVISCQHTYKGVQTVATINTWVAENLNNGDRVIAADTGTTTLGGVTVVAGQELVFYKTSETAVWQTSAGAYKLKQTEKADPAASGNGLTFIATITQNANGEITATKTNITTATSNNDGLMTSANVTKLTGISTGANKVEASDTNGYINIDGNATKVYAHPTPGVVTPGAYKVGRDALGHVNFGTTPTALAVADISGLQTALDGKQAAGSYKTTQTAVSVTGSGLEYIQSISQDTNGVITPTKGTIRSGTTSQTGVVQLQNSLDSTTTKAVTPNAVNSAINGKTYLNATLLTSSNNLDVYTGGTSMRDSWYYWTRASVPTNAPVSSTAAIMQVVFIVNTCVQTVWVANSTRYCRICDAGTWTDWWQQYYEATSTYSSTGTQMVNGTAVAEAINALDATITSTDGTNVQAKVTETDGKITAVNITTDNTENKNNKVSAFQDTPDDTHYPSELLVYSQLAVKKDVQDPVSMPTTSTYTGLNFVSSVTQDNQGVITPVLGTLQEATTSVKGITKLVSSASASSTDETTAVTPKGVATAIKALTKSDSAASNKFVTAVSESNGVITVSRAQPVIANVSGLQTALDAKEPTLTLSFSTSDNSLTVNKSITVG